MILDMIQEWFKELLIDGIISNLTGMFDTLNTKVGEIAGEVGMTPATWNSSIFNMIRNLSETVIVPISRDNVSLLNKVRTKAVHFAWDNPDEDLTEYFRRFRELTSIKSDRNRRVYVLTNYGSTHEQDLYRVNTLRALGYDPYVMIYERPTAPRITRHLQRWVNNKRIFHSVSDFKDYAPMKKEV